MNITGKFLLERAEKGQLPDRLIRKGIRSLCRQRLAEAPPDCETAAAAKQAFITSMNQSEIAPVPQLPNEQHYEVPAAFFNEVLGAHKKYSCCSWGPETLNLDEAEKAALEITCQRAELSDGQSILELGCGWGSLTLWMAERFPESRITAVSNSSRQKEFILAAAQERKLENLQVITADMNDFETTEVFDRVVSIEMFEHMRNYRDLLGKISRWLRPDGLLFIHIFCHRSWPYEFLDRDSSDWMSRHFFTGGIMPSDDLILHFQDDMVLLNQWRWSGEHYRKTAEAWLRRMDQKRDLILPILASTYGSGEAERWFGRWRIFFMSCAELFGYASGQEWWVSHYLLKNRRKS